MKKLKTGSKIFNAFMTFLSHSNVTYKIWTKYFFVIWAEAVARRFSVKKVLLKISQNSHENTCVWVSFLIKLKAETSNFIKKETLAQVFSYEFEEF